MSSKNQTENSPNKPILNQALFITFLSSTSQMSGWYLAELSFNTSQAENSGLQEAQANEQDRRKIG
jgi:hypothetical protein